MSASSCRLTSPSGALPLSSWNALIPRLINCAAVQETPALLDPAFDLDAMHREIAINFTAACHLTARLLPLLAQRPEAFVLTVNSGLGLVPKTSSAVYCGTKGGLNIFTLALRNQLRGTPVKAPREAERSSSSAAAPSGDILSSRKLPGSPG